MYGTPYYEPYKGFVYAPYEDREDDNVKIFHNIEWQGRNVEPDWFAQISPYQYASREEFHKAVDEIYFQFWVQKPEY